MPKPKRPPARPPRDEEEGPDFDALAQSLADLAVDIARAEGINPEAQRDRERELLVAVRRALRKKHDEVLYGAIELARFADAGAGRLLRTQVEEEAATLRIRREDGPELEIDCFLVPLFVRSTGGLAQAEEFQDEAAYDALAASFRSAGLDSAGAKVALMRHAYDLAEIDQVGYTALQQMLHEAAATLSSKKPLPAPALEASMRGWQGAGFGLDEEAMELRFLMGFSLKRADDPFYRVPDDEDKADAWFSARMERYRAWTEVAAPLVARCLAADPGRVSLNFLYQDLFYGAREQGASELAMLETLSRISQVLDEKELAADRVHAVVAAAGEEGEAQLRVNLYAVDGGPPWASVDKAVDPGADLAAELDELCEALLAHGIEGVSVAQGFGADGHPQGAIPFGAD